MQPDSLTPPDEALRSSYLKLIAELEKTMETLTDQHFSDFLNCRPGCCECCIEFSVLAIEAAFIVEILQQNLTEGIDHAGGKCHLLKDKLCQAYSVRPIICRTQGLPIAYIDEEEEVIQVSACPVNFADNYNFTQEGLLFLDSFNEELRRLNDLYCQTTGIDPRKRIAIAEIAKP